MKLSEGKRFREILRAMHRVMAAGVELDGPMLDVYWLALKDWTLEEFEQACGHLTRTAKFMPRPADFTNLRKASLPTAGEAWVRAKEHARSLTVSGGHLQERPSGDPLLDAVARSVGGYKAIASATERDLLFLERTFAEHFESIGDREEVREALPQIAGEPRHLLPSPLKRIGGKP